MRVQQDGVLAAVAVATSVLGGVVLLGPMGEVSHGAMRPPAQPSGPQGPSPVSDPGIDVASDTPHLAAAERARAGEPAGAAPPSAPAGPSSGHGASGHGNAARGPTPSAPDSDAAGTAPNTGGPAPATSAGQAAVAAADGASPAQPADDAASGDAAADGADDGTGQWVWPAAGKATSEFGPRWGRMHKGLDVAAAHGSPVVAAAAGHVAAARSKAGYGRIVKIVHPGGTATVYAHLSAISVASGETVAAGQRVGAMGCTGSCTGAHLHFEVRRHGTAIDPRRVLP